MKRRHLKLDLFKVQLCEEQESFSIASVPNIQQYLTGLKRERGGAMDNFVPNSGAGSAIQDIEERTI